MTDGRAAARLEEAIEAYFVELGDPSLVLDWVLVVHRVDAEDRKHTEPLRSPDQPSYRAYGLVKYAAISLGAQVAEEQELE